MGILRFRQPNFRRFGSGATVLATTLGLTLLTAAPATAATGTGTAPAVAAAMATTPGLVTGASFTEQPSASSAGVSTDSLASFPVAGSSFGILSTGDIASIPQPGTEASTAYSMPSPRGDSAEDVTVLKVDLTVPAGANCMAFDFKFLSEEYPQYVNSKYNDAFIAELDNSTWSTSGSTISAPNNFAYDAAGDVVSINSTGVGGMSPAQGVGTAFDSSGQDPQGAATGILSAAKQVTPGAHSLYLSIFDQGDFILDSAVFLDNLRAVTVADPATNCKSGTTLVSYSMALTPATGTGTVGTSHTVTATVTDQVGAPVVGGTVNFVVTGANTPTGSATTDANGKATLTYTGAAAGDDTISACFTAPGATSCGNAASVQYTWTAKPVPVDVTPTAPTVVQATCESTTPSVTPASTSNVTYAVSGTVAAGNTVTVTATPATGYQLATATGWTANTNGTATYSVTLTTPSCSTPVAPVAPTVVQATCDHGKPSVTPASTSNVTYAVSGTVATGNTVTVTATSATGYQLAAATGWTANTNGTATYSVALAKPKCETAPPGPKPDHNGSHQAGAGPSVHTGGVLVAGTDTTARLAWAGVTLIGLLGVGGVLLARRRGQRG